MSEEEVVDIRNNNDNPEAAQKTSLDQDLLVLEAVNWDDHEELHTKQYKSIFDAVDSDDDDEDDGKCGDYNAGIEDSSENRDDHAISDSTPQRTDEVEPEFGTEVCIVEQIEGDVLKVTDEKAGISLSISRALMQRWNEEETKKYESLDKDGTPQQEVLDSTKK